MYSIEDIHKAISDPLSVAREVNRLIHTRCGRNEFNPRGVDIFDEDWDNLIILDACRYDVFEERYGDIETSGTLQARYALGSSTSRFIRANFSERVLHDTVYVSANPWYLKLREEINSELHRFIYLPAKDHGEIEWVNEQLDVVTPATVTKFAKQANEDYPEKRLIVHYLQPHHPFIGPIGEKYFDYPSSSLIDVVNHAGTNFTDKHLREAYNENFDRVITEVEKLLPDFRGKSIVTADHGEMLGDRHDYLPVRDYGHHRGIYNDPTVKIPWFVVDGEKQKTISTDPPANTESEIEETKIDEHLRHLGYKL